TFRIKTLRDFIALMFAIYMFNLEVNSISRLRLSKKSIYRLYYSLELLGTCNLFIFVISVWYILTATLKGYGRFLEHPPFNIEYS
ncbi:MAG: hypothetical protein JHC31_06365, partial [Sulfurihydrogenibium sp.]|nr:hypothetical protein [Sulfurihydrogenibium sp.]